MNETNSPESPEQAGTALATNDPKPKPASRLEAFEHYYQQGINGTDRSLGVTAAALHVKLAKVKRWAKLHEWDQRCYEMDNKAIKKRSEIIVESVAEIKARYHNRISGAIELWFKKNFSTPEAIDAILNRLDPDDIVKWTKLSLILLGEPDAVKRIEQGAGGGDINKELAKLTDDDLRAFIASRNAENTVIDVVSSPVEELDGNKQGSK